jgi:hypothetical protein
MAYASVQTSVDVLGYYSNANYYGAGEVRKLLDPKLDIQEVLITSTHNHEGPDTVGIWGLDPVHDGKYPRYLHFVDREIAKAITQAAQSARPARMRLGRTDPQLSPSLADLQTRTEGRPPKFFDEELRVMQFLGIDGMSKDKTIATIVNWNTHPESMEDENTILTSDFPHTVRESLEKKYGLKRSREATLANLERLEAGNYISRSAAAGHAYSYRVRILPAELSG